MVDRKLNHQMVSHAYGGAVHSLYGCDLSCSLSFEAKADGRMCMVAACTSFSLHMTSSSVEVALGLLHRRLRQIQHRRFDPG